MEFNLANGACKESGRKKRRRFAKLTSAGRYMKFDF